MHLEIKFIANAISLPSARNYINIDACVLRLWLDLFELF